MNHPQPGNGIPGGNHTAVTRTYHADTNGIDRDVPDRRHQGAIQHIHARSFDAWAIIDPRTTVICIFCIRFRGTALSYQNHWLVKCFDYHAWRRIYNAYHIEADELMQMVFDFTPTHYRILITHVVGFSASIILAQPHTFRPNQVFPVSQPGQVWHGRTLHQMLTQAIAAAGPNPIPRFSPNPMSNAAGAIRTTMGTTYLQARWTALNNHVRFENMAVPEKVRTMGLVQNYLTTHLNRLDPALRTAVIQSINVMTDFNDLPTAVFTTMVNLYADIVSQPAQVHLLDNRIRGAVISSLDVLEAPNLPVPVQNTIRHGYFSEAAAVQDCTGCPDNVKNAFRDYYTQNDAEHVPADTIGRAYQRRLAANVGQVSPVLRQALVEHLTQNPGAYNLTLAQSQALIAAVTPNPGMRGAGGR